MNSYYKSPGVENALITFSCVIDYFGFTMWDQAKETVDLSSKRNGTVIDF